MGQYDISYGSKYDENLSRKEIAARVRVDIKEGVKAGELPDAKYSVRIESYAGGGSINVTVTKVPFDVLNEERVFADHDAPNVYSGINWRSDAAMTLEKKIDAILRAYNFDGSDIQSDYFHVNFYSHVRIESDNDAERAAMLARREARGARLGRAREEEARLREDDARLEALATAERAEVRADILAETMTDENFTPYFF